MKDMKVDAMRNSMALRLPGSAEAQQASPGGFHSWLPPPTGLAHLLPGYPDLRSLPNSRALPGPRPRNPLHIGGARRKQALSCHNMWYDGPMPELQAKPVSKQPVATLHQFGVHPSPDYTVYANPDRVGRILKRLSLHQSWLYDAILEESEDHVPHLSLEEEETEYEEDHYLGSHEEEEPEELPEEAPWYEKMSRSEAKRLHLARAFIANPEVMVLHNPLGDLDENLAQDVAQMLRDFVDHRGLELDDKAFPWHRRRRRTAFFSANDVFGEFKTLADVTCSLGDQSEVVSFETCAKTESKPGWWNCA